MEKTGTVAKLLLIAGLILGMAGPAAGFDPEREGLQPRGTAIVTGKSPQHIVISNHQFKMTGGNWVFIERSSKIIDVDGKQIRLKDLKLPCKAAIKIYSHRQKEGGGYDYILRRLQVLEYPADPAAVSDRFNLKPLRSNLPQ